MLVDLRSDTVTRPTPGMRAAMADADVGDDVYAEDPTIRRLEETVAELFGHEAAVFAPTGTMANQIALRLVCPPATELLCDADAHIVTYEGAGAAARRHPDPTIPSTRAARSGRRHQAAADLGLPRCGYASGRRGEHPQPWRRSHLSACSVAGAARDRRRQRHRAALRRGSHLERTRGDGNPAVVVRRHLHNAVGLPVEGSGRPVGSLVVCSAEHGSEARVLRARLGGGWRQAGILAAAGLYALEHHVQRLDDDHRRAAHIAAALDIDPSTVDTNIVLVDVDDSRRVAAQCRADGVLVQRSRRSSFDWSRISTSTTPRSTTRSKSSRSRCTSPLARQPWRDDVPSVAAAGVPPAPENASLR